MFIKRDIVSSQKDAKAENVTTTKKTCDIHVMKYSVSVNNNLT